MSNAADFQIENGTLVRYLGADAHVVVPDSVKDIGPGAFRRRERIRSVQLPESVAAIRDNAFQGCIALEEIHIPAKVTRIGKEAFRNCRQLRSITFAGTPKTIGLLAFFGCWKLADNPPMPLQDFFTRMREGKLTLAEGKNLYQFSKAKGVASIKKFDGLSMMAWDGAKYPYRFHNGEKSLIIPVSIDQLPVAKVPSRQIPEDAIVYCQAEQFDKLPRANKAVLSVQWLMQDSMLRETLTDKILAFMKKYTEDVACKLMACEDPAVYQRFVETAKPKAEILEMLLEQCSGKADILAVLLNAGSNSPKATETLSLDAKPKVTAAELKKRWTYDTYTLGATGEKYIKLTRYKGLGKHVEIPAFIGKVPVKAVEGMFPPEVESVEFPGEEIEIRCSFRNCKAMADENGFIFVRAGRRCVLTDYVGRKDIDVLTVPEGVTETVGGVFKELLMREAVLPEGFLDLGVSSFAGCPRLQIVRLPESLQRIRGMAFSQCKALRHLYIPEGVTRIEDFCARNVPAESFTIYGKRGSAAHRYARENGNLFVEGKPDTIPAPDFLIEDGVLTGYVGNGGDLEIPEGVTEIAAFACYDNSGIRSLTIGAQVRVIREYAFASCQNLTAVRIGGHVKTIENNAFQFTGLRQAELESGVETIGQQAFGYLFSTGASIKIPATVQHIGAEAFCSQAGETTLHGTAGSYAESYAKEHNIPFVEE